MLLLRLKKREKLLVFPSIFRLMYKMNPAINRKNNCSIKSSNAIVFDLMIDTTNLGLSPLG